MKAKIVDSLVDNTKRIECVSCGSLIGKILSDGTIELMCRKCKKHESKGKNEVKL